MHFIRSRSIFVLALVALPTLATAQTTTRASLSWAGVQGDQNSTPCALSDDGRFVVFESSATNLVQSGFYGYDVYVRDRQLGTTERVSIDSSGGHIGNHGPAGGGPAISWDGRFVAFGTSLLLEAGDTNNTEDVYLRDRVLGTTERVSLMANGAQILGQSLDPAISADGRYVAFRCSAPGVVNGAPGDQLYIRDRQASLTEIISVSTPGLPNVPGVPSFAQSDGQRFRSSPEQCRDVGRKGVFITTWWFERMPCSSRLGLRRSSSVDGPEVCSHDDQVRRRRGLIKNPEDQLSELHGMIAAIALRSITAARGDHAWTHSQA